MTHFMLKMMKHLTRPKKKTKKQVCFQVCKHELEKYCILYRRSVYWSGEQSRKIGLLYKLKMHAEQESTVYYEYCPIII